MIIAAFDMGTRNFAFCVERRTPVLGTGLVKPTFDIEGIPTEETRQYLEQVYNHGSLIECQRIDLVDLVQPQGNIYLTLTSVLDRFGALWDHVDVFLVERQMSYGHNKSNIQALRLAQHCLSYFYTLYGPFKTILEWPSTFKTRILGCPQTQRQTHRERKQFSIQLAKQILHQRKDPLLYVFDQQYKQDDIADCILMTQTYAVKTYTTVKKTQSKRTPQSRKQKQSNQQIINK
jgi:hypothetical protein